MIKCSFLGTFELTDCKAQTITDKICSVCNDVDLSMNEKMCDFGSDGASAMIGNRNGVGAKLKEKVPWLVNSHSVAHRLVLASSQAAVTIAYMHERNLKILLPNCIDFMTFQQSGRQD